MNCLQNLKIPNVFFFLFAMILLSACSSTQEAKDEVPEEQVTDTKEQIRIVNREAGEAPEGEFMLLPAPGAGLGIIEGQSFETGTIEIDLKGEDAQGSSFIGVAFNMTNDSTYEAIYFRPFNFKAETKLSREHSVQYVYEYEYPWRRLRTEHEGVYEAEIMDAPDPNDWFSVQLVISNDSVNVLDKSNGTSLLAVERIAKPTSDKIAYWVGHNSKGHFRNLDLK